MDAAATLLADLIRKPGAPTGEARARHRRLELPCATDTTSLGPLIRQLAAALEVDVKDKTYRLCPVGETVGRYLETVAFSSTKATHESYESVLALLARCFDDFRSVADLCDQPDLVEQFIYKSWGGCSENTRVHHWKVLNYFFGWCVDRGLAGANPMRGIKKPRKPRSVQERRAYEQALVRQLVDAQPSLRNRCGIGLMRLALRKNDLRMMQLQNIDLVRDQIHCNHAKGGQRHKLPIVFADLRSDLAAYIADRTLETGADPGLEYLIYPKTDRYRPMDPSSLHRWFKECLEVAGLPTTIKMHELRHTAVDHTWRTTGNIVIAQKLARHSSPATTAGYLHPNEDDLRAGLALVEERWLL